MSDPRAYPARLDAALDEPLSRWLWLVKWLLLIPHFVCLALLWPVFLVVTVVAFFAILFTGRYPAALLDLNVGILRWGWRVAYYGNAAFGTDRYPPFSLRDDPDYPAHFDVDPPQRLSRGLVLVKWWLLAIPHYLVVALLCGGGLWFSRERDAAGDWRWSLGSGGLVGLLALVAGVVLLFAGTYPRPLFDLLVGLSRWVFRVAAYAALMTDEYPPFRLDLGGTDPGTAPVTPGGPEPLRAADAAGGGGPPPASGWTPGRTVLAVAGALVLLLGTAPLLGGAAVAGADRLGRDDAGYVTSPDARFAVAGRAVVTDGLLVEANGPDWAMPDRTLGTVRVRVTPADPARPVFVGIAPADDVDRWLSGAAYATVERVDPGDVDYVEHAGTAVPQPPAAQGFWVAQASGAGERTVTWTARTGEWTVVVLNADASPGVDVRADVGATLPVLGAVAAGLVVLGVLLLVGGTVLLVVAVAAAGRRAGPAGGAAPQQPVLTR